MGGGTRTTLCNWGYSTLVFAPRTRYATIATPLNKPKRQDPDAHGRSQRFCPTDANASHLVAALIPLALSLPLPSCWFLAGHFPVIPPATAGLWLCVSGWPSSCLKLIIMGICNCHIRPSLSSHFLLRISRFYSGWAGFGTHRFGWVGCFGVFWRWMVGGLGVFWRWMVDASLFTLGKLTLLAFAAGRVTPRCSPPAACFLGLRCVAACPYSATNLLPP